ncbi:MAG: 3-phosphoshikimate 1-carboxyvinyltransferase [Eubacteriales bacterium]
MKITLCKPCPHGEIDSIPSKSYAHRALICAALADSTTKIECSRTNRDIDATVSCLRSLGAKIDYSDGIFTAEPIKNAPESALLHPGESGSTLRFLLPVVAALGVETEFVTEGRLLSRPLSPLSDELIRHGAKITSPPLRISGRISGGRYSFDGSVSSQFTTGLMLALPIIEKSVEDNSIEQCSIELTGKIESKPYIDLSRAVLEKFGVKTESDGSAYIIKGRFSSPEYVRVEGDWSNAAFMLCAGALSEGGITVRGLDQNSTQGDKKIVEILEKFGAAVEVCDGSVTVRKRGMRGITIDAADIPDLVPVISVVASAAEGDTVIENCSRLRLKESDRVESVCAMITSLGGEIESVGDSIVVHGRKAFSRRGETEIDSYNDHRIVMSAAVASILFDGCVTIDGCEAVSKSYPDFFDDFGRLCVSHQDR